MKHVRLKTCVGFILLSTAGWSILDIIRTDTRNESEIDLVVVVCHDRLTEAVTMLKSALALATVPVKLHVFTEEHMKEPLQQQVSHDCILRTRSSIQFINWNRSRLLNATFLPFTYKIYSVSFPNSTEWPRLYRPCASQRLFLPVSSPFRVVIGGPGSTKHHQPNCLRGHRRDLPVVNLQTLVTLLFVQLYSLGGGCHRNRRRETQSLPVVQSPSVLRTVRDQQRGDAARFGSYATSEVDIAAAAGARSVRECVALRRSGLVEHPVPGAQR